MQLPLSHFCSLPSPLSQYHSLFTKLELGGIYTLVCHEVPVWDEQMLGFCHTHLVNSVFCLPVPIPHTLRTALLQCQLSQMLPHHPKGKRGPKENRVRQKTLLCKGRKNRLENHFNCVCLWREIVSSMLHVSKSEIIKQHHSVSITFGVRLNLFRLLHQMVHQITPAVI